MTRFDFDKPTRDLFNQAVKIGVIDAIELAVYVANHGTDVRKIIGDIDEAAWPFTLSPRERPMHAAWCEARDAYGAGSVAA